MILLMKIVLQSDIPVFQVNLYKSTNFYFIKNINTVKNIAKRVKGLFSK